MKSENIVKELQRREGLKFEWNLFNACWTAKINGVELILEDGNFRFDDVLDLVNYVKYDNLKDCYRFRGLGLVNKQFLIDGIENFKVAMMSNYQDLLDELKRQ